MQYGLTGILNLLEMRYCQSPKVIIDITLQPSILKCLTFGLHIYICNCRKTLKNIIYDNTESTILIHKEENTSQIKTDSKDRLKIPEKLAECIHPIDSESYPKCLI